LGVLESTDILNLYFAKIAVTMMQIAMSFVN